MTESCIVAEYCSTPVKSSITTSSVTNINWIINEYACHIGSEKLRYCQ